MRSVFLVGCPRSGTSWVRNILGAHPEVHAGPESHLYPTVHGVAAGWPDGDARWREVVERYDALAGHGGAGPHRWIDRPAFTTLVDRAERSSRPDALPAADDVVAGVIEHYATRHRLDASTVLVEKTPDHIHWASRILERFPDARIVEVRRDGRDVCVSMERRAQRVAWPPKERRAQIERWIDAVEAGLRHEAHPPTRDRWHVVRFEDLTHDRLNEIRRLYDFAALPGPAALITDVAERTDITQELGRGDGEHVRSGAIGDWRRFFDGNDRRLIEELAGDLLQRAGYRA